jgi:SPP1 gp7 family putative phage head morphogenesis protein
MNKEDKELKKLEKRLAREYQQAYSDISKKCDAYFKKFEKQDKEMKEKLPHDEYVKWRQNKMLTGKRWTALRDSLAKDYTNVNQIAARMIREDNIGVMTDAFNHGTYEVEKISGIDTNFTIYNRDSVENIIKNDPDLLPVNLDIPKDLRWNKSKVNSAITQGILQGKPIKDVAKQLESVTDMNKNAAIRNARTMNTYARNAGRLKSYERADKLGVKTRKMWLATLDGRTRHSHRMMDREIVSLDEAFSNGLMEPGDPDGAGGEIYNCRCRMIGVPNGINPNTFTNSRVSAYLDDNGVSYEEWKKAREPKEKKDGTI